MTVFVASLEFLKMSSNLPSNFPDLEKVWKIEVKSWKLVKSLDIFFFFESFFLFWSNLIQSHPYDAGHQQKSFVPAKVSIDHLFDNLESRKSLEFWIQKLIFTNPDWKIYLQNYLIIINSWMKLMFLNHFQ